MTDRHFLRQPSQPSAAMESIPILNAKHGWHHMPTNSRKSQRLCLILLQTQSTHQPRPSSSAYLVLVLHESRMWGRAFQMSVWASISLPVAKRRRPGNTLNGCDEYIEEDKNHIIHRKQPSRLLAVATCTPRGEEQKNRDKNLLLRRHHHPSLSSASASAPEKKSKL